jgi:hypothetical protein
MEFPGKFQQEAGWKYLGKVGEGGKENAQMEIVKYHRGFAIVERQEKVEREAQEESWGDGGASWRAEEKGFDLRSL